MHKIVKCNCKLFWLKDSVAISINVFISILTAIVIILIYQ